MGITITGGNTTTGTITPALFLSGPGDDPVLITTGAEGALGTIVGAVYGIAGSGSQDWTITNQGTVQATLAGVGVVLNAGGSIANQGTAALIYGSAYGARISGVGTITNGGSIAGAGHTGVILNGNASRLDNGGDASTAARISGGVFGARLGGANVQVTNGGTISGGFYDAVLASNGGTVTNGSTANSAARIDGNRTGIGFLAGTGTVVNHGTISGAAGSGVALLGGGSATNAAAGTIAGSYAGIEASAAAATIANDGTITASSFYGVILRAGGTVTNAGTAALIGGAVTGVLAGVSATVTNRGLISGQRNGIAINGAGAVTNGGSDTSAARIIATDSYADDPSAGLRIQGAASVSNWGTIAVAAAIGRAVLLEQGGTLANLGSASAIYGGAWGVLALGAASIDNAGVIASRHGVDFDAGGSLRNTGTIQADDTAVHGNGGTVRLTNRGWISGGTSGVQLDRGGVVRNGTAADAGAIIYGADAGLVLAGPTRQVINDGTIGSDHGPALDMRNGGTVTNGHGRNSLATIAGYYGIRVGPGAAQPLTVINTGTISGLVGIAMKGGTVTNSGLIVGLAAIIAQGTVAATILNSGAITSYAGQAIGFADADGNVFGMTRQSTTFGLVQGGALTDTLRLTGATPVRGVASGLGSKFTGFERVEVADGGLWRLTGLNTLPGGATLALDGALEVAGTLAVAGTLNLVRPAGAGRTVLGVTPGGIIEIGAAGGALPGRITVDADGRLVAAGELAGRIDAAGSDPARIVNNGTIAVAEADSLTLHGRVSGSGTFELGHNSQLILADLSTVRNFLFPATGSDEQVVMEMTPTNTPILRGFADADSIALPGFVADPLLTTFAAHVLTLHEVGGGGTVRLQVAGPGYQLGDFLVAPGVGGGTLITHM